MEVKRKRPFRNSGSHLTYKWVVKRKCMHEVDRDKEVSRQLRVFPGQCFDKGRALHGNTTKRHWPPNPPKNRNMSERSPKEKQTGQEIDNLRRPPAASAEADMVWLRLLDNGDKE